MKFLRIPANKTFELTNMQFYSHHYFTLAIEVEGFDEPTTTAHTNILSINAQKVNDDQSANNDSSILIWSNMLFSVNL